MGRSAEEEKHAQGAALIWQAFERARQSGAREWQTMTSAVLKNRLLDLTQRTFRESDWKAKTFREFLDQFEDVVMPVPNSRPFQVTLRETAPAPTAYRSGRDLGSRRQIRPDLWQAVMDVAGGAYGWDGERAVVLDSTASGDGVKQLPTLEHREFNEWRRDFVTRQSERNPDKAPLLESWFENEHPLMALPGALRIEWVVELKSRVLGRLEEWFKANGLTPPHDLVFEPRDAGDPNGRTEKLRQQVLEAVRAMSKEELEALQLPAAVLLRMNGRSES